jgi:ribonuclease D
VPPEANQQQHLTALAALVKDIAKELQISPEILATRRDLQQLINGRKDLQLLKGWRREIVGEVLLSRL